MIDPDKKANSLVLIHYQRINDDADDATNSVNWEKAKLCAIATAIEIIKEFSECSETFSDCKYWMEVITRIKKL